MPRGFRSDLCRSRVRRGLGSVGVGLSPIVIAGAIVPNRLESAGPSVKHGGLEPYRDTFPVPKPPLENCSRPPSIPVSLPNDLGIPIPPRHRQRIPVSVQPLPYRFAVRTNGKPQRRDTRHPASPGRQEDAIAHGRDGSRCRHGQSPRNHSASTRSPEQTGPDCLKTQSRSRPIRRLPTRRRRPVRHSWQHGRSRLPWQGSTILLPDVVKWRRFIWRPTCSSMQKPSFANTVASFA